MKLSEELTERGFIYQFSGENLSEVLDKNKQTVYLGIDPTAASIHIGNLVPYMLLNHFLKAGHRVVLLIGGATALIGDPSGRDSEREMVDEEVVKKRAQKITSSIKKLTIGQIKFVNNHDWIKNLSAIDFLREVGKHFTVNALIKKDAIKDRLESENGISYTEFSYNLIQSYDFYHLSEKFGCTIQIGGSDQWGNITGGIDYIRRKTGKEVYGLTMPLVVDKATGKKFGKSMGNAVWLDEAMTSPYDLYQFWINTTDDSVFDYLKMFTFLSLDKIKKLEEKHNISPEKRLAQQTLANEVVTFVHGKEKALLAEKLTKILFGQSKPETLNTKELTLAKKYNLIQKVGKKENIIDLLIKTGLASSKTEARKLVDSSAITINGKLITSVEFVVEGNKKVSILKRGKKQAVLIQ
jgi:tyrosyl-tRNA synthetase